MLIPQIVATEEHSSEAGCQARFRRSVAKGNKQYRISRLQSAF